MQDSGNKRSNYYRVLADIRAVITRPMPNPAIMDPTNAKGAFGKKKNPTPIPIRTPPPIAQVLLSFFLSGMLFSVIS